MAPKTIEQISNTMSQYIMLFHSNYHSTLWINFNHPSIYIDIMAKKAPYSNVTYILPLSRNRPTYVH
mgnify:CR=1 FL=1